MKVSPETFFQIRREFNAEVFLEELHSHYNLALSTADGIKIYTEILKNSAEETDFLTTKQTHCNKRIIPAVLSLITHDFSNPAKWTAKAFDENSTNSSFAWKPSTGKKLVLQEIQTSSWKDLSFDTGQHIKFMIWESITAPCPDHDPLHCTHYNDSPAWVKVWPENIYAGPTGDNQEVAIYVCFNQSFEPLYKVTEFTYASPFDFTKKARRTQYNLHQKDHSTLGDVYEQVSWYAYADQGVHIELRDSRKERIECCITNDEPLDNDVSGISSTATAIFKSYDEW